MVLNAIKKRILRQKPQMKLGAALIIFTFKRNAEKRSTNTGSYAEKCRRPG